MKSLKWLCGLSVLVALFVANAQAQEVPVASSEKQPVVDQPAVGVAAEKPVAEKPAAKKPKAEKPVAKKPKAEVDPFVPAKDPKAEKLPYDESPKKPARNRPAKKKPAVEKPAEKPMVKPAAKKPAVEMPAPKRPALLDFGAIPTETALGIEETYLKGLTYVDVSRAADPKHGNSIQFPSGWIYSDGLRWPVRTKEGESTTLGTIVVMKQVGGENGRLMLYDLPLNSDQSAGVIAAEFRGNVAFQGQKVTGNAGEKKEFFWYVNKGDNVDLHIAYLLRRAKGTTILRFLFPVPQKRTPANYHEKEFPNVMAGIGPIVDQFYGDYEEELAQEGLVYNGSVAKGRLRVTLRLPEDWVYTEAYGDEFLRATERIRRRAAVSVRYYDLNRRVKTLAEFKNSYPAGLKQAANALAQQQTEDEHAVADFIAQHDLFMPHTNQPATWDYGYVTRIPLKKGELSHFYRELFVEPGNGTLVVLKYQVPIKADDIRAITKVVGGELSNTNAMFESLRVRALNN